MPFLCLFATCRLLLSTRWLPWLAADRGADIRADDAGGASVTVCGPRLAHALCSGAGLGPFLCRARVLGCVGWCAAGSGSRPSPRAAGGHLPQAATSCFLLLVAWARRSSSIGSTLPLLWTSLICCLLAKPPQEENRGDATPCGSRPPVRSGTGCRAPPPPSLLPQGQGEILHRRRPSDATCNKGNNRGPCGSSAMRDGARMLTASVGPKGTRRTLWCS